MFSENIESSYNLHAERSPCTSEKLNLVGAWSSPGSERISVTYILQKNFPCQNTFQNTAVFIRPNFIKVFHAAGQQAEAVQCLHPADNAAWIGMSGSVKSGRQ